MFTALQISGLFNLRTFGAPKEETVEEGEKRTFFHLQGGSLYFFR